MSTTQDEIAVMTAHVQALASIPVTYPDDHVPDPEEVDFPKKMTPFPVNIPAPPEPTASGGSGAKLDAFSLTIKSSKPPITFTLENVSGTDTILSIKDRLASEHSRAPPSEVQRLLLKGKVLADGKLLQEYLTSAATTSDDNTITLSLMIKPGANWTAEEKAPVPGSAPSPTPGAAKTAAVQSLDPGTRAAAGRHSRTPSEGGAADQYPVPSLVLSTPMSPSSEKPSPPVPLDIADQSGSRPGTPSIPTSGGVGGGILAQPMFWVHLREFLHQEVKLLRGKPKDADDLFESFLVASKGSLEATDVARIRDAVNITGMAGT